MSIIHHYSPSMIRALGVVTVAGSLLAGMSADAAVQDDVVVPPLVTEVPDDVDPDVRAAILGAYARAAAEPANADLVGRLGMQLQANGEADQAALVYGRAIALDPSNADWHYYSAMVQAQLGNLDGALAHLSTVLALRPLYEAANYRRANLLYLAGDFERSRRAYADLAERHPDSGLALYGVARAQQALGDTNAARDTYERACHAAPTFGGCHHALSVLERRLGRTAAAEAEAQLAERYRGQLPTFADPLGDRIAQLATGVHERIETVNALIEQDRLDEAAAVLEELFAGDPENLSWILNLLKTTTLLERHDRADEVYEQALQNYSQVAEIHGTYAASLIQRGRLEQAGQVLRRALALDPDDATVLTMLGGVLEAEGQLDAAMAHYSRALTAQPTYSPARFNRAKRLITVGRDEDALIELRRIIDQDDTRLREPELTVSAMILAAGAEARLGRPEQGRRQLEEARLLAMDRHLADLLAVVEGIQEQLRLAR